MDIFCGGDFKMDIFFPIQIQSCGKEILMANNNGEFIYIILI